MALVRTLEASGTVALDNEVRRVGVPSASKVSSGSSVSSPGPSVERPRGSVREEVRKLPGVGASPISFFRGALPVLIAREVPQVADPAPVTAAKIDNIPDSAKFRTALDKKVNTDAPVRRDQTLGVRDGSTKRVFQLFADGQVRGNMPPIFPVSRAESDLIVRAGVVPRSAGQSDRVASNRGPASLRMKFVSANESRQFEILSDDPAEKETAAQTAQSNESIGIFSGPVRNVAVAILLVGALGFVVA